MAIKKAASKKKVSAKKVGKKVAPKKVVKKVASKKRVVKKAVKRSVSKQHPIVVRMQEFFSFFSSEE